MKLTQTAIPGVLILEPTVFADARGHFSETYNQRVFDETVGYPVRFVQDNQSRSSKAVLRGLHYQLPPDEQGKLVRVSAGRIFDVAVDLRPGSATLGQWAGTELSGENHRQLWVPSGLAHGFVVLSDIADLHYKVTGYYAPASERSIRWDDADLAIAWPSAGEPPRVSTKDQQAGSAASVISEIRNRLVR